MQRTSLAELKTGKEKLALINIVLENIDKISTSLDNTRIDEIVGLKESVKALRDEVLGFKNEVLQVKSDTSADKISVESVLNEVTRINAEVSKVNDKIISFNTQKSEVEAKMSDFNANLSFSKNEIDDKINTFNGNFTLSKNEKEAFFNELGKYKALLDNFSHNINEVESIIAKIQGSVNNGKDFAVTINTYTTQALAIQKLLENLKTQVETMKNETSEKLVLLENFNEQFKTLYETKRVDFKAFVEAERNYTKLEFKELSRQNLSTIYAHLFSLENLLYEKGIISLENS